MVFSVEKLNLTWNKQTNLNKLYPLSLPKSVENFKPLIWQSLMENIIFCAVSPVCGKILVLELWAKWCWPVKSQDSLK